MPKTAGLIGVYGCRGSGKTTRTKALLRGRKRVVAFDPLQEYRGTAVTSMKGTLDAIKAGWRRGFRVAYYPPAGNEAAALHRLSKLLMQVQQPYKDGIDRREITLVVEEMSLSYPVTALPRKLSGFSQLCSIGRHYGIEVIGTTQRLAEINTRFRGNTSEAYLLSPGLNPNDIASAIALIGRQHHGALTSLKTHEFLHVKGADVTRGKNRLSRSKS